VGQIAWNPKWETGVPLIDGQHHRLLSEFNDFFEAIQTGLHRSHIENLLEFLLDFLDTHFEEEEIQMRITHYPGLIKHQAYHEAMRFRAHSLVEAFRADPFFAEAEVVAFVKDWMDNHIGVEDSRMAQHILKRARVTSPLQVGKTPWLMALDA
jgi:hemerythrin